jgi:branched-chain amino acid transport system permease protein
MGINPAGIFAKATGIAMIIVTIAALYLGMRSNFDPSIGPARLIYAFEAVIIGGLGSLWGTLRAASSSAWRRPLGRDQSPNGRSWRGMSPS